LQECRLHKQQGQPGAGVTVPGTHLSIKGDKEETNNACRPPAMVAVLFAHSGVLIEMVAGLPYKDKLQGLS
jgi:hypothetical protein